MALIQQDAESIQKCWDAHIQGTKLPFHHIPKMLYWVEIW